MMTRDKNKSENEDQENDFQPLKRKKNKKLGGYRTLPFILGEFAFKYYFIANEMCDRFATAGSHANLITYLTRVLNLPNVKAANTLTNFAGTSNFTPLVGALIADSFAGRFWTVIVGLLIYELGLISMTLSATLPHLRPPPCPTQINCQEASSRQLWVLYASLLLWSFGTGGIRPCVLTFAADQFDMSKSKLESQKWNFFNLYYFFMMVASLGALTIIVYIQDNVGWGLGFGIPSITMAISVVIFVLGSPFYTKVKPGGSPLTRLAQVVVAAVKKRKVAEPENHELLYQNRELDAVISTNGRLLHTLQFKWLDKAAIATKDENTNSSSPNLWRLSTVHRVEELKSILRMIPIWTASILLIAAYANQNSFIVLQARTMDRHITHTSSFQIPPASLSIFTTLTVIIGLVVYERLFVPFARKFTKNPSGITCLQRMGIGMFINILATIVQALVEVKRKSVAKKFNLLDSPTVMIPISVFWMLPQFILHGLGDVFFAVGHLEFLYDQSPESIRSTVTALYWVAISLGNYIGTFMVTLVHKYTGNDTNWLPNKNLNRGRLENFYWLMTLVQVVNLSYYIICAHYYTYKPLEEERDEDNEGDLEVAKDDKSTSTEDNHVK